MEIFKINFFKKRQMDPVQLFPKKVTLKIFDMIKGYDLLQASLVSKDWYKFIATSPEMMDKIKISLGEFHMGHFSKILKMSDVNGLISGGRKYQHIAITCNKRQISRSVELKLLMLSFQWKSVEMCNYKFKTEMEMMDFLGMFEPFVEKLILKSIDILKFKIIGDMNFEFPKLKILKIIDCHSYIQLMPFNRVTTLKQFKIGSNELKGKEVLMNAAGIKNILISNSNIRDLNLSFNTLLFNEIFMYPDLPARIEFRLERLQLSDFRKGNGDQNAILKNFVAFMALHSATLQQLICEEFLGFEFIENVFNHMKVLKELTIQDLTAYGKDSSKILTPIPNYSIECLNIWSSSKCFAISKILLKAAPLIKKLIIGTVNQDLLNSIGENEQLESLDLNCFIAHSLPDPMILSKLKEIFIRTYSVRKFFDSVKKIEHPGNFASIYLDYVRYALKRRRSFFIWGPCLDDSVFWRQ